MDALVRIFHDLAVVEGQGGQFGNREPRGVRSIGAGLEQLRQRDQGVVGHRHNAAARVAAGLAEGVELLQVDLANAGILMEFADGGGVQRFVLADEAAGKRVTVFERLGEALDQQEMEPPVADGEQDDVDGHKQLRHIRCFRLPPGGPFPAPRPRWRRRRS